MVGGSANFFMIREFAKQADRFFAEYDREFVLGLAQNRTTQQTDTIDVSSRQG